MHVGCQSRLEHRGDAVNSHGELTQPIAPLFDANFPGFQREFGGAAVQSPGL